MRKERGEKERGSSVSTFFVYGLGANCLIDLWPTSSSLSFSRKLVHTCWNLKIDHQSSTRRPGHHWQPCLWPLKVQPVLKGLKYSIKVDNNWPHLTVVLFCLLISDDDSLVHWTVFSECRVHSLKIALSEVSSDLFEVSLEASRRRPKCSLLKGL